MFSFLSNNKELLLENTRLKEEIKNLKEEIEHLERFKYGAYIHQEELEKYEQFFIKLFRHLHLKLSVSDFTKQTLDSLDPNNCPDVSSDDVYCEDFKVWCLQVAKKKYGNNTDAAIEYAQKLYNFISKR